MDEEAEDFEGYTTRFIGDHTAFMKWSTEAEPVPFVIDKHFLMRNRHLVADINKFLALSNITTARAIKLFHLRRNNITLATVAGLEDIADETLLANIADYQTTRGIRGFFQNALITQKRELEERHKVEKRGFSRFGKLFKQREEQEISGWLAEE